MGVNDGVSVHGMLKLEIWLLCFCSVTVHGFKGSEVQRLHSYHHTSFCERFVQENPQLPHHYKSGTWYLAIMWQNQNFLQGLRVFNFDPVPNPER